jgi:hypothetical protein
MIVKRGNKYFSYSADGKTKLGGPYNTKGAANIGDKQAMKSNTALPAHPNMRNFLGIRAQATGGTFRTEKLLGREYLVVPVTALVEGVIQGITADEPELALAEEFGKFPQGWNGRPCVMDHPEVIVDNQIFKVSANSPAILEKYQFGFLFNSQLSDKKLITEAWIDVERAKNLNDNSRAVYSRLQALKAGEALEVSTGLFTGVEKHQGRFNGKDFGAIWTGVVPDHLAFLPEGAIGACSVADGCGAGDSGVSSFETLRANVGGADCQCTGDCDCGTTSGGKVMTRQTPKPTVLNVAELSVHGLRASADNNNTTTFGKDPPNGGGSMSTTEATGAMNDPDRDEEDDTNNEGQPNTRSTDSGELPNSGNGSPIGDLGNGPTPPTVVGQTLPNNPLFDFNFTPVFANQRTKMKGLIKAQLGATDDLLDSDVRSILSDAINTLFPNDYSFVVGFTTTSVVFCAWDADNGDYSYFQVSFEIGADKVAVLGKDFQEVILTTQITPVQERASINTNAADPARSQESNMATAAEARKFLVNFGHTEAALKAQTDEAVLALHATVQKAIKDNAPATTTPAANSTTVPAATTEPVANTSAAAAAAASSATGQTLEQLLANADPSIRESIAAGVKMHQSRKEQLIKALTDTGRCKIAVEVLRTHSIDMLENLAELAAVPQTFEGLNRGHQPEVTANRGGGFAPKPPTLAVNNTNRSATAANPTGQTQVA